MPRYYYVYILESRFRPDRPYVGMTNDLRRRLAAHNAGQSKHTAKFRPWSLRVAIAFPSHKKALAFERYLKSHPVRRSPQGEDGAGRAFAAKRL